MKIPKEKLFLRNRDLELNPNNQKKSTLYKKVRDHIKKIGYIINPLLAIEDGDKYKIVYGYFPIIRKLLNNIYKIFIF